MASAPQYLSLKDLLTVPALNVGSGMSVMTIPSDYTSSTPASLVPWDDFKSAMVGPLEATVAQIQNALQIAPFVNPVNVNLTGVVAGTGVVTGKADTTIVTTIANNALTMDMVQGLSSTLATINSAFANKLDVSGTAVAAQKLATTQDITLTGVVTGSAPFDGTDDAVLSTSIANGALSIAMVNNLQAALDGKANSTDIKDSSKWAAPMTLTLSGLVTGSVSFDGSTNVTLNTTIADGALSQSKVSGLTAALTGKLNTTDTAVAANKWASARTLTLSGDTTGSVSIDGTSNVSIATTTKALGIQPLAAGVDLNTIIAPGVYPQDTTANATLALNYPVALAGLLEVFSYPNSAMYWQRYTAYSGSVSGSKGTVYVRGYYHGDGAWSPWSLMWSDQTLPLASLATSAQGTKADSLYAATLKAGVGLTGGGAFSSSPTLALGTPSAITLSSSNSASGTTHSHALSLGGSLTQYLTGAGTLVTFPTTMPPSAHTQAWSTITATPTTLAGYGITDAVSVTGNAASASKWATARTLSLTGGVTGSVAMDGSGNPSMATTVAAAPWGAITGKPTTVAGYGITDIASTTPIQLPGTGDDLNTHTSPGFYVQTLNSGAVAGANYPQGTAGLLEVQGIAGQLYQFYTILGGQSNQLMTYKRSYYSGQWFPWFQTLHLGALLPNGATALNWAAGAYVNSGPGGGSPQVGSTNTSANAFGIMPSGVGKTTAAVYWDNTGVQYSTKPAFFGIDGTNGYVQVSTSSSPVVAGWVGFYTGDNVRHGYIGNSNGGHLDIAPEQGDYVNIPAVLKVASDIYSTGGDIHGGRIISEVGNNTGLAFKDRASGTGASDSYWNWYANNGQTYLWNGSTNLFGIVTGGNAWFLGPLSVNQQYSSGTPLDVFTSSAAGRILLRDQGSVSTIAAVTSNNSAYAPLNIQTSSGANLTHNGSQIWDAGSFNPASYLTTSGTAAGANWASVVNSYDAISRNPNSVLPTSAARSVRFDFVNSGNYPTGGSTYAGVMTWSPWDGTTNSTGDASYQIGVSSTGTNGSGVPVMAIRKGIDSTWNSWYTIWNSALLPSPANQGNNVWFTGVTVSTANGPYLYEGDQTNHSFSIRTGPSNAYNYFGFTYQGYVTAAGVQAPVINAQSDRRLKKAIHPLKRQGRLRPVSFRFRRDDKPSLGFIAQDVQALYPELVGRSVDDRDPDKLVLNYNGLIAVIADQANHNEDAITKLRSENASLKKRLRTLETKVNRLLKAQH